ncbi:hypothetical protein QJQ45_000819 [Haematococcus lacustris]|nr:hypothetical protein QJQ45_000819 [Haematococcus lacustris]
MEVSLAGGGPAALPDQPWQRTPTGLLGLGEGEGEQHQQLGEEAAAGGGARPESGQPPPLPDLPSTAAAAGRLGAVQQQPGQEEGVGSKAAAPVPSSGQAVHQGAGQQGGAGCGGTLCSLPSAETLVQVMQEEEAAAALAGGPAAPHTLPAAGPAAAAASQAQAGLPASTQPWLPRLDLSAVQPGGSGTAPPPLATAPARVAQQAGSGAGGRQGEEALSARSVDGEAMQGQQPPPLPRAVAAQSSPAL